MCRNAAGAVLAAILLLSACTQVHYLSVADPGDGPPPEIGARVQAVLEAEGFDSVDVENHEIARTDFDDCESPRRILAVYEQQWRRGTNRSRVWVHHYTCGGLEKIAISSVRAGDRPTRLRERLEKELHAEIEAGTIQVEKRWHELKPFGEDFRIRL